MENIEFATSNDPALRALQQAFADFQTRADMLSSAYASMQIDFHKVNLELDAKNAQLADSLRRQQETQAYLTSILESMNSGVVGVDIMGSITHFNRAAGEITGYRVSDVMGKPYGEFFKGESAQKSTLVDVLSSSKELKHDEKVIWHRDGHPVPVSFQTALLRDKRGDIIGAVEIFSDVSRIKALEEEMQRTRTMAALGEMAATVAHEIRNPLGAMGVWAGLLERDLETNDPRRKTLGKITEGLSRLNRIVSNLLVYSRPMRAEVRATNLAAMLQELTDFMQIEIERQESKVTICKEWNENDAVSIMADPEKMHQAILNLLLNAVQAMPEGGTLSVGIEKPRGKRAGYVAFRISDTGVGIPAEHLDKVCDPFYTTKENGTGLGLAIVRKTVEYHSGFLNIDSTVGKGTTIRVFLPRTKEQRS